MSTLYCHLTFIPNTYSNQTEFGPATTSYCYDLLMIQNVYSVFSKAQDDALKYLVLSTTQKYSVHFHKRGKKPGNMNI